MSDRDRIESWLIEANVELHLFDLAGQPSKQMELKDGDGWRVLVNMGHPCSGTSGSRGVLVQWFEGDTCCERFTWKELRKARDTAMAVRLRGGAGYSHA